MRRSMRGAEGMYRRNGTAYQMSERARRGRAILRRVFAAGLAVGALAAIVLYNIVLAMV